MSVSRLLLVLGALSAGPGFASFLELPASPRAIGMGDAFVAVADDPFAALYNPAGLARLHTWSASASYERYLYQVYDDRMAGSFLSVTSPYGLGISYQRFRSVFTTEEAVRLTASRGFLEDRLFAGASGSLLRSAYGNEPELKEVLADRSRSASSMGLDAGVLFDAGKDVMFGVSALQLLSPDLGILGPETLDPLLRAGISWRVKPWKSADLRLCSGIRSEGEARELNAGVEVWDPLGNLALRAGVAGRNVSTGFSVRVSRIRFDYAFMTYWGPEDLTALTHHLVSLTWTARASDAKPAEIVKPAATPETAEPGMTPEPVDTKAERERLLEWSRENARKFVSEGSRSEEREEYGAAVAAYGKALAWDPENLEASERLTAAKRKWVDQTVWNLALEGKQAYEEGKMTKAISKWQQALSYRPEDPRLQGAIEVAIQAKVYGPQRSLLDGLKAYLEGDWSTAVREWELARNTYPRNEALEKALEEAKRRSEGGAVNRMIPISGGNEVQRLSYEAIVYERNGRNDLAVETWRKILERDPGNAEAKQTVAELEKRKSSGTLPVEPRTDPRAKSLYEEGLADYAAGDLDRAIRKWEEALRLAPEDVNIQNSLIRARMERDPDEPGGREGK